MVGISADYDKLDRKEAELRAQKAPASTTPESPADTVARLLGINPHVPAEERLKALGRKWITPR